MQNNQQPQNTQQSIMQNQQTPQQNQQVSQQSIMQNQQAPQQNQQPQLNAHANQGLPMSFDDILKELQITNQKLNQGLPLEDALQAYEKGVKLFQQAQYLLNEAEERMKRLKDVP